MMDKQQFLLTKIAEEASEVAKQALKTQQFGNYEVMPGQPFNNIERLHEEITDLNAVIQMFYKEAGIGWTLNSLCLDAKKAKVEKYLEYSISLGRVMA